MNSLLLIDTAIQGIAVGLSPLEGDEAGEVVWSEIVNAVGDSARLLPLAVDAGLKHCGMEATDVVGIVVTTGPGSFTGLRVGLAYAMGFAAGVDALRDTPMGWLGRSSLGDLAESYFESSKAKSKDKNKCHAVVAALAATKTTGYAAHCNLVSRPSHTQVTLLPLQVEENLSGYRNDRLVVIGDWALLENQWPQDLVVKVSTAEASVSVLKRFAEEGRKNWPGGFSHSMPAPNYLRKSSVEEKEKEKEKSKGIT